VTSRAYTIHLFNEMSEAWIRTTAEGKVWLASPNVANRVHNLDISNALEVLRTLGWEVENWEPE